MHLRHGLLLILLSLLPLSSLLAEKIPVSTATPEPSSRHNRGNYFLRKGETAFQRGDYASAEHRWEISAYMGHKVAQYNLGLMYFKGVGLKADRPRGVAFLAVAAERGDPPLEQALQWAYAQLTPEEARRADTLWREQIKPRYADEAAMPRAMSVWRMDLVMATGSHTGHVIGPLEVTDLSTGIVDDGMTRQRRLHEQGGPYTNPLYPRVEVGDLVPLEKKRH